MSLANTPPPRRTDNPAPGTVPSWLADDAPSGGSWTTVEPPRSAASVYDMPPGGYMPADYGYARSTYQPTAEQLARDEARRAYWRRNVRLPLLVAMLVIALALVALLVLAFGARYVGIDPVRARSLISGLSGLTVILISLPLIAVMSLLPLAYAAWWYNRRQNRKLQPEMGPMAYRSRVQTLLWQLDSLLDRAERATTSGSARLAWPLIGLHARADYWRTFVRGLRRNFGSDKR